MMLGRLQIQLMWSNCTLRSVFLADACLWIHPFSSWFTIQLHPMTPAVRTNTSSQYNWPIYDFFKVPDIKNDTTKSHLFLLQLLLYRQNRITLFQPFAISICSPMMIFTYTYHKKSTIHVGEYTSSMDPSWDLHTLQRLPLCSTPVLRVNRFWTSSTQWMKSPQGRRLRVDQTPTVGFSSVLTEIL